MKHVRFTLMLLLVSGLVTLLIIKDHQLKELQKEYTEYQAYHRTVMGELTDRLGKMLKQQMYLRAPAPPKEGESPLLKEKTPTTPKEDAPISQENIPAQRKE